MHTWNGFWMIGVGLKCSSPAVVEEFFQLFKTPWEFFRRDTHYSAVITEDADLVSADSRLIVVMESDFGEKVAGSRNGCRSPVLVETDDLIFPVYSGVKKIHGDTSFLVIQETGESVGSRSCGSGRTVLKIGLNLFQEAEYLLVDGQPAEFAEYPTLDIHIANLRRWMIASGSPVIEIPPVPDGHKFFVFLSHDVDFAGIKNHKLDRTLAGFTYRAMASSTKKCLSGALPLRGMIRNWLAVASLPLVYTDLVHDFWHKFGEYTELEKGAGSTFFIVPFKGKPGRIGDTSAPSKRAVKYEADDLGAAIATLLAQGNEVGVHGIDSWHDIDRARQERRKIEKLTGRSNIGIRMHWLYFSPESPAILDEAGYAFDSTCGYNEKIGCRAGTLQVFKPLNAGHLLELPLHIMDTALFYPDRMNLTMAEGLEAIKLFSLNAVSFGGVLTMNWHHRSIAPERLWDGVYRDALRHLRSEGGKLATAGTVIEWFRKRRAAVFDRVIYKNSTVQVKFAEKVGSLDGLVLRAHQPCRGMPAGKAGLDPTSNYRDCPVAGQSQVTVSLSPG